MAASYSAWPECKSVVIVTRLTTDTSTHVFLPYDIYADTAPLTVSLTEMCQLSPVSANRASRPAAVTLDGVELSTYISHNSLSEIPALAWFQQKDSVLNIFANQPKKVLDRQLNRTLKFGLFSDVKLAFEAHLHVTFCDNNAT